MTPFVGEGALRELGADRVETPEDVYEAARLVTLHLPLTYETRGSLGKEAFAQMKERRAW